ncbi:MAG TPA: hypothetical protein VL972_03090 [Solirubrobacteraceae bacterium]|nr:hypothetical protein [Solirubrobacteraceae bacterium]
MEYRSWIAVADVPFSDEPTWMRLAEHLERAHPEFGPVASWEDDGTTIVFILANDEPDRATAAANAARVVSEALHTAGLADRFPEVCCVEEAHDLMPASSTGR